MEKAAPGSNLSEQTTWETTTEGSSSSLLSATAKVAEEEEEEEETDSRQKLLFFVTENLVDLWTDRSMAWTTWDRVEFSSSTRTRTESVGENRCLSRDTRASIRPS